MQKGTVIHTLIVAVLVCLVCSLLVSVSAVTLKSKQIANASYNEQVNIVMTAGLLNAHQIADKNLVNKVFSNIDSKIVELSSGQFVDMDVHAFSLNTLLADKQTSKALTSSDDIAGLKRLENFSKVYMVQKDNKLDTLILPIRGYGLWSTLYGYIALESDFNTVRGLIFYKHAETPGLGGEVDNPEWQKSWRGKKLFADSNSVQLSLVKGGVDPSAPMSKTQYQVDALAGATLTSRGINNLLTFWFSDKGFKNFLQNYKQSI